MLSGIQPGRLRKRGAFVFAVLILFVEGLAAGPAAVATKTWSTTAGRTNWGSAKNWFPAGVPATGDDLVLVNRTSRSPTDQNLAAGFSLKSLTFSKTASGFTAGANALTLTGNPCLIVSASALADTLSSPLTLSNATALQQNSANPPAGQVFL